MRTLTLLFLLAAAPAPAWDGNLMWNEPTTGPTSGGAGIWGTGGAGDKHISCSACHVQAEGRVGLTLTFTPALQTMGATQLYRPGQRYQVTAALTGQWKGKGFESCGQYVNHTNGFGAAFELADGTRSGRYESDDGQDSDACPATVNATSTNSTITYGRCHAVLSNAAQDMTQWTFSWTAPAAGAGATTVFWGVVDGNCDMKSTGDDAKVGTLVLAEGVATRGHRWWPAGLGVFALGVVPLALRRRRNRREMPPRL